MYDIIGVFALKNTALNCQYQLNCGERFQR